MAGLTFDFTGSALTDGAGVNEIMWGAATTDRGRMNTTSTNAGGWNGSMMRTGVGANATEGNMPRIRDAIASSTAGAPGHTGADLVAVLKMVDKPTATSGNEPAIIQSPDTLFLFSRVEVDGTNTSVHPGEGSRYPWWASHPSAPNRIKQQPAGTNQWWWLRSPWAGNTAIATVNSNGSVTSNYANNAVGVSFGLCV
jgi:hypothetical protein